MERSKKFRHVQGKNLNLTQIKCDQDSHVLESEEVTITLVLYSIYIYMLMIITITGWLLCPQGILMLWDGNIIATFNCDENMHPPETKTKTDHSGPNRCDVSVWAVNNTSWWKIVSTHCEKMIGTSKLQQSCL